MGEIAHLINEMFRLYHVRFTDANSREAAIETWAAQFERAARSQPLAPVDAYVAALVEDIVACAENVDGAKQDARMHCEELIRTIRSELSVLVARLTQERDTAHDEEMTPHAFVPHNGDWVQDIWCKDCAYHRDHQIHIAALAQARDTRPPQEPTA